MFDSPFTSSSPLLSLSLSSQSLAYFLFPCDLTMPRNCLTAGISSPLGRLLALSFPFHGPSFLLPVTCFSVYNHLSFSRYFLAFLRSPSPSPSHSLAGSPFLPPSPFPLCTKGSVRKRLDSFKGKSSTSFLRRNR